MFSPWRPKPATGMTGAAASKRGFPKQMRTIAPSWRNDIYEIELIDRLVLLSFNLTALSLPLWSFHCHLFLLFSFFQLALLFSILFFSPCFYRVMRSGFASLNEFLLTHFGVSTSLKERVWLPLASAIPLQSNSSHGCRCLDACRHPSSWRAIHPSIHFRL